MLLYFRLIQEHFFNLIKMGQKTKDIGENITKKIYKNCQ